MVEFHFQTLLIENIVIQWAETIKKQRKNIKENENKTYIINADSSDKLQGLSTKP